MRFAALRVITLSLLAVCLACSGDTVTPTAPELDGFGTLTTEGKPPPKCTPWPACKDGGDGETEVEHSYLLTFDGDVKGGADAVNKDERTVGIRAGTLPDAWLDITGIAQAQITNWSMCFGEDMEKITHIKTNVFSVGDGSHFIAAYVFDAVARDGIKPIRYRLRMVDGVLTSGNWLPDQGSTSVVSFSSWEMVFDKGGKKGACLSDGLSPFVTTATIAHSDSHE